MNPAKIPHCELLIQLKSLSEALEVSSMLEANHTANNNVAASKQTTKDSSKSVSTSNAADYIARLLTLYCHDEIAIQKILNLTYQVVRSVSDNSDSCIPSTTFHHWAELLVSLIFSSSWNKTLISNALLCLKLYTKAPGGNAIVGQLWHKFLNIDKNENSSTASMHVLIQFYDEFLSTVEDFKSHHEVEIFVHKLLSSNEREERKAALYLLRKMYTHYDGKLNSFWISYITIQENLEENQSHLILPSLNSFKQNSVKNDDLQAWLDALYIKILSHQNILVIRWALEYILQSFTCAQISENVLLHFMKTSNNTSLYNNEGYFLPTENIQLFLNDDIARFVKTMTEVEFKCVPLHFWLTQINMCGSVTTEDSYELILKIAAKIRVLQNIVLRTKSIELFEKIFHESINRMNLSEYVVLVETLYNITDPFNNFEMFHPKLVKCLDDGNILNLTQRFYEITTNNLKGELALHNTHKRDIKNEQSNKIQFRFLEKIANNLISVKKPVKDIIWLLLMIVFESENSDVVHSICQRFFDLNLKELVSTSFKVLKDELIFKLTCEGDTSTFVNKKIVDLFVKEYLTSFSDLCKYMADAEEILTMGSHKTVLTLSQLLADYNIQIESAIIDTFIIVTKKYSRMPTLCYTVTENILKYLKNFYSSKELMDFANQILSTDLENIGICEAVLNSGILLEKETYIRGIIMGEPNFGDARTEELYLLSLDKRNGARLHEIRTMHALSLPVNLTSAVIRDLISIHMNLSIKKPRYFEHSMEHRLKMRIAKAIVLKVESSIDYWEDDLLNTLLSYNNQLNINYIHEFLVAKCARNIEPILNKLDGATKCTPSQQVSLISTVYCYYILNFETITKESHNIIINNLFPLTMGAHFQTRLYAQLAIYKILNKCNEKCNNEILLSKELNLQRAIALTIGPYLKEVLNDVRLLLPHIYLKNSANFFDIVMFITSAPVDEYSLHLDYSGYEESRRLFCKKKFSFAKETPTPEHIGISTTNWNNLQRKMNPESELAISSFGKSEKPPDYEMFVVASFIDKIPNLGGIARTCEVLGIKNLILSCKKIVEKDDFKNVSMTAEKYLNIIEVRLPNLQEFFKEKQAHGFKIVGAEQTVDSVSIIGFKFPRKCVLVLGHEKEGIPSNILGFLDNTIEIPQFGLIRSLNVHVTGAMFMWEYCKQHIVGRTSTITSCNSAKP